MCGINGILFKKGVESTGIEESLRTMNDLIIHRGPDSAGDHLLDAEDYEIAMAMRRLSIIDLASGEQPMYSEDSRIAIVFNGEIYNFRYLKSQLLDNNVTFNTDSDTEVILKLYETYGIESFKLLDGMFAISIADHNTKKLIIARDYFGEKPLYYFKDEEKLIYASELKSIIPNLEEKPQLDKEALSFYFRLTYIPAPYTIYKNIRKLEPNSIMTISMDSLEFEFKTIHPKAKIKKNKVEFTTAKNQIRDKVYKSVESRSVSDVPLGTFLSGGVDSSIVSWCLADMSDKKIDTFSIGFNKKEFDETDKSQRVAQLIESNHHEFILEENDLREDLDTILLNFDEPFADSSALPTYLVSKKTSGHVKVALTGDGGDEVFGGYNKYYTGKINQKYTALVPQFLHEGLLRLSSTLLSDSSDKRGKKYKIDKMLKAMDYQGHFYWNIISLGFSGNELETYLLAEYQNEDPFLHYKQKTGISNPKDLDDFRIIDQHISLEGDMLVKVDRSSMLNSLECRAPFLNKDLFDYTLSLPTNFLLKGWDKKHILKEAFKDKFPSGFLNKSKQGFGVPVGDWLRSSLKNELLTYIEDKYLEDQGIFNIKAIQNLVSNHIEGKIDSSFKVWTYYCFQKWYANIYQS